MNWQPIKTLPKEGMFIWGYWKTRNSFAIGLGYTNVSGGWCDIYNRAEPHDRATHWMALPEPPKR